MIAYICALPQEAKHLRKLASIRDGHAQLIVGGVGPDNAQHATYELLATSKPTLVISTGVAGALSPTLQVGDVVVATKVIDQLTGEHFRCSSRSTTSDSQFSILSASRMITSAQEKKLLREKFNTVAVDMESTAIARVCAEQSIPFSAIRAISDSADEVLPEAITRFFDAKGALRPFRVVAELVKSPSLLKALRKLQAQTDAAGSALRTFLESHPL